MQNKYLSFLKDLFLITIGSGLYGISTVLFIFPHSLLLGGTSGISVILERFLKISPGNILMIINFSLLIVAFFILGKEMAIKTTIGSALTTLAVGIFEKVFTLSKPLVSNIFISAIIGAAIIALASGIMFYINSSLGGTDIIALIVKKFSNIKIGKALLLTDFLIVIFGGCISGIILLISSFIGLLIKTLGIDAIISIFQRHCSKKQ